MANKVYTIGREYGSNGRLVGEALAARLGIKCYDKELLKNAAKESGLCEEIFENHDEKPTKSFLYSLVMDSYSTGSYTSTFLDMPLNNKIFLAQFDAIKQIAENESCVIVGRCADYALAKHPEVINIFVHANMDDRIRNVAKRKNLSENKARDLVNKTDKQRSSYYNYYTSKKWGEAKSYDLCLNTSKLTIEQCVDVILSFRDAMDKKQFLGFINERNR